MSLRRLGFSAFVLAVVVVTAPTQAAVLLQHGLSFDEALSLVTLDAAKILKLDDRVGSIARGKDGDLALFDGDPFEYTTRAVGTIIDGKLVSETTR